MLGRRSSRASDGVSERAENVSGEGGGGGEDGGVGGGGEVEDVIVMGGASWQGQAVRLFQFRDSARQRESQRGRHTLRPPLRVREFGEAAANAQLAGGWRSH